MCACVHECDMCARVCVHECLHECVICVHECVRAHVCVFGESRPFGQKGELRYIEHLLILFFQ